MALFESYERRIEQIKPVMEKYGIRDFDDALNICKEKGFNPYEITRGVQTICFENACWAYTLGAAIAIKKGCTKAADAAKDSCPAKNAKHFVSSVKSIDAKFPCPNPTFLSSATEPGIQNA